MNAASHILNSADEALPAPRKASKPNGRNKSATTGSSAAHAAADAVGIIREWAKVYSTTATHCAVCGTPLRDSVSVARGIGPDCSGQHYNLDFEITDDMVADALGILHASNLDQDVKLAAKRLNGKPRDLMNILIWWSSAHLDQVDVVLDCAEIATALGFISLGERLRERNTNVIISKCDDDSGDYLMRCRSKSNVRRNMARLVRASSKVTSIARQGRFKYGWRFPANLKSLVWAILGEDFGNEFAAVPTLTEKTSQVIKVDFTTWRTVRSAFEAAFPRPTIRTAAPVLNIVRLVSDANGKAIEVHTPSRNFAFVDALKQLPSRDRRWNPKARCWTVNPAHEVKIRDLVAAHFNGAK